MKPYMSVPETRLFESFLRSAEHYLEFGAGGSTCTAVQLVKSSVTALDSSRQWLDKIARFCAQNLARLTPALIHADIGPLGDWGYPSDPSTKGSWPNYHSMIWRNPDYHGVDLYMVDGRFRVACFMQTILHCRPDAVIAFHDFASRPEYHIVKRVAREIAAVEELSVFVKLPGDHRAVAEDILKKHWLAAR